MKKVVITGSSRGVGFSMAEEFLKAGCCVTLSGRALSLSDEKATLLESFKDRYIYVPCDVQSKESLQNLWDKSVEQWSEIDIWINNAGQNVPHEYVWETGESYTKNVIATNITGMIFGSQIATTEMLKQKHGSIYSMDGLGADGRIQIKTILYGTTKYALTYFMNALAKELKGTGIVAGRLSPGMMLTDFITKSPDGDVSEVISDKSFRFIFNTLGEHPETVAKFFVPRILRNTKNGKHINFLSNGKAMWRFMTLAFLRRKLI